METTNFYDLVKIPDDLITPNTNARFTGASWYNKMREKVVMVAGLGGIGSFLSFLLSRLNIKTLVLYDGDVVNTVNLSGQLYSINHINYSKSLTMVKILKDFSNYYNVIAHNMNFEDLCEPHSTMFCGFDNMEARRLYFNSWRRYVRLKNVNGESTDDCIFMDGRLNLNKFQVIAITGDDIEAISKYEKEWLFDDAEAQEGSCTAKQTTYMASMIASVMVNIYVNFVANEVEGMPKYRVPFLTEYNSQVMHFETNTK